MAWSLPGSREKVAARKGRGALSTGTPGTLFRPWPGCVSRGLHPSTLAPGRPKAAIHLASLKTPAPERELRNKHCSPPPPPHTHIRPLSEGTLSSPSQPSRTPLLASQLTAVLAAHSGPGRGMGGGKEHTSLRARCSSQNSKGQREPGLSRPRRSQRQSGGEGKEGTAATPVHARDPVTASRLELSYWDLQASTATLTASAQPASVEEKYTVTLGRRHSTRVALT